MDRTKAPAINDYTSLHLPVLELESVKARSGESIGLSILNRGVEPVAKISALWPRGSIMCNPLEAASVMATALREGTKTYTGNEIEELLDFNGAWLNIGCDKDNLIINLYTLSRNFSSLLPLLKEIIMYPSFPADRINHVKSTKSDELKLKEHKVDFVAKRHFTRLMTGQSHPYSAMVAPQGFLIVNREEVMESYNLIVKESLPSFWLGGNISSDMTEQLKTVISELKFDKGALPTPAEVPPYSPMVGSESEIEMPESKQAAVVMGLPVPGPSHPDFEMIRLCSVCLGGYFGSRLNTNIREEKGLTYGIHSVISNHRYGSYLMISAQTTPENVGLVIDETKKEIKRLASEPPRKHELETIKRYVMSMLASTIESPFSIIDFYMALQMQGTEASIFEKRQMLLKNLSPQMFADCAKRYFNCDNLITVIAK